MEFLPPEFRSLVTHFCPVPISGRHETGPAGGKAGAEAVSHTFQARFGKWMSTLLIGSLSWRKTRSSQRTATRRKAAGRKTSRGVAKATPEVFAQEKTCAILHAATARYCNSCVPPWVPAGSGTCSRVARTVTYWERRLTLWHWALPRRLTAL